MAHRFPRPLASIVIPAFNEEDRIANCLEALAHQTARFPFEVIVVDNCCTDRTPEIALSFEDRLDIRVVRESRKGRGAARQRGFSLARASIILSTDADATAPAEWVRVFTETLLRRPDVVAVTGFPRVSDCTWFQNTVFNTVVPAVLRLNVLLFGHIGLSGFSFAIRKSIYEQAGGFDPLADAYEDLELAMRVHPLGKIAWNPSVRMTFSGRRFQNGLIGGCFEYTHAFVEKFFFRKRHVPLSDVGRSSD